MHLKLETFFPFSINFVIYDFPIPVILTGIHISNFEFYPFPFLGFSYLGSSSFTGFDGGTFRLSVDICRKELMSVIFSK